MGDFDWLIHDGEFGLSQTIWEAPTSDHTIGSAAGHYMYLDVYYNYGARRAVLESGVIGENQGVQCVGYWVQSNRNNQARLGVNVRDVRGDSVVGVFAGGLDATVGWKLVEVQLADSRFPYAFQIEGECKNNFLEDLRSFLGGFFPGYMIWFLEIKID